MNPLGNSRCLDFPGDRSFNPKSAEISLKIYHITGEQVAALEHGRKPAGEHSVTWSSMDIPSGTYICVLENITDAVSYRILIIKE